MDRRGLRDLFLALLGFTYLIAFASVFLQAPGLYGANGINMHTCVCMTHQNSRPLHHMIINVCVDTVPSITSSLQFVYVSRIRKFWSA